MNAWEKRFAEKVEVLRERAVKVFDCFVDETVVPVFTELSEFTARLGFHCSCPQRQKGLRSFKFALSESAYVLCVFRARGVADVEFEHEAFAPRRGQAGVAHTTSPLAHANREWVEGCLRAALDVLVEEYANSSVSQGAPEPVTA